MKNKYYTDGLSYFSKPRIHGNVFAWNKPAPKPKRSKQANENIQRWEDDGGPVSETGTPLSQVPEKNTDGRTDIAPETS